MRRDNGVALAGPAGTPQRRATGLACRQWVMHDHWKPYFTYQECLHALCNEHLLRELKFLWEEEQEVWAQQLSELLLEFYQSRQKHGALDERQFKRALRRYRLVVRRGRYRHPRLKPGQERCAQSKAANLLDRLEDFDLCVLAVLADERVPFTNNQGEQDIRMVKVRQKISGCFRTLRGAQIPRSESHFGGMLLPRASPQAKWGATNVIEFTPWTT
jgi:transposase